MKSIEAKIDFMGLVMSHQDVVEGQWKSCFKVVLSGSQIGESDATRTIKMKGTVVIDNDSGRLESLKIGWSCDPSLAVRKKADAASGTIDLDDLRQIEALFQMLEERSE